MHADTGIGLTVKSAIDLDTHRQMQAIVAPGAAEAIRADDDRGEGCGRLGVEEAEAVLQVIGHQLAQRDVVANGDEANGGAGLFACCTHGHRPGDNGDLGLEIEREIVGGDQNGRGGRGERIGAALIEQRTDRLQLCILAALERADAFEMAHIAGAIDPLKGARQRGQGGGRIEGLAGYGAGVELSTELFERRSGHVPVVEGGLKRGCDAAGRNAAIGRRRNHDQLPIGAGRAQGCQFHAAVLSLLCCPGALSRLRLNAIMLPMALAMS